MKLDIGQSGYIVDLHMEINRLLNIVQLQDEQIKLLKAFLDEVKRMVGKVGEYEIQYPMDKK